MDYLSRSAYKLLKEISRAKKGECSNPIQLIDDDGSYARLSELGFIEPSDHVAVVLAHLENLPNVHKSGYRITEKGLAYISQYSTELTSRRWSLGFSVAAIVISIVAVLVSIYK